MTRSLQTFSVNQVSAALLGAEINQLQPEAFHRRFHLLITPRRLSLLVAIGICRIPASEEDAFVCFRRK